jgi:hypothetical protein
MLITPLFVRLSFLLKVIVLSTNIGGQHNNLNQKRPTDKQWGNQHWGTTQLPKVRKRNGQTME